MSKPKISVIIPVYNGACYIEKCLNSVLNQSLNDIEIIVVNDSSTDDTSKLLEKYNKQYCEKFNILTLRENKGAGFARNLGLDFVKGEYVAFIDSDDYIDSDYFEILYNSAVENDADIAVASILKHKALYNKYNVKYTKESIAFDIDQKINLCGDNKEFFFYCWNKIYRTAFVKSNKISFMSISVYEDVQFAIQSLYYSNKVVSVIGTKYHYIERSNSLIKSEDNNGQKLQNLVFAYQYLQKFCRKNNIILPERLNYYTSFWFCPFVKTYIGEYYKKDLLFGCIFLSKQKIDYSFPVDLVYLWVDGKDLIWQEKKQYWQEKFLQKINSQAVDAGRFVDNEELKYSLRSVEKFASWINKIYIITDGQIPEWLDVNNPKINVIFHKDFIDNKYLPLFNSEAIETFLADIPGLSENFLYANDDMYFGRYVNKFFFFNSDAQPIIRLKAQVAKKHIATSMYTRSILKQQQIIKTKYNKNYHFAPHHNIDAYTKSAFSDCINSFFDLFTATRMHKFRGEGDIQRVAISYYMLAFNLAKLKKYSRIDRYFSPLKRYIMRFKKIYQADSIVINMSNKNPYHKFKKYNPTLFCTNDGEGVSDFDRKRIKIFLDEAFPEKSSFEL